MSCNQRVNKICARDFSSELESAREEIGARDFSNELESVHTQIFNCVLIWILNTPHRYGKR
jgi:hypothetical protein